MSIMNPLSQSWEMELAPRRRNVQWKQEGTCWVDLLDSFTDNSSSWWAGSIDFMAGLVHTWRRTLLTIPLEGFVRRVNWVCPFGRHASDSRLHPWGYSGFLHSCSSGLNQQSDGNSNHPSKKSVLILSWSKLFVSLAHNWRTFTINRTY